VGKLGGNLMNTLVKLEKEGWNGIVWKASKTVKEEGEWVVFALWRMRWYGRNDTSR